MVKVRKVYIMRGVSGSGKSTKARELAGETGKIHSTDDYFMKDGVYNFDPRLLGRNHMRNFSAFQNSLNQGIPIVICDNTNSRHWEYEKYVEAARNHGYEVEIVQMPHPDPVVAAKRNAHGVPETTIRRLLVRWED